jgi:large subunit ribosomal protein L10
MKKEDKSVVIASIASLVQEYSHFYVTDITALNSEKTSALRRRCYKDGIKLMVVKNTLLIKALDSLETDYSALYPALKGNTALMFCNTGNVPAKLIKEEGKETGIPALKAACVSSCNSSSVHISSPCLASNLADESLNNNTKIQKSTMSIFV